MDPLSALSLAAEIVQFVDFGFKVSKRLSEYVKIGVEEYPRALQTIATQLPLLLHALKRVEDNVKAGKLDFNTRCILKGVVAGCHTQVERISSILDGVASQDGDSVASKAKKALKSLYAEEKIVPIEKNLQTYISVLILHHVVDDKVAISPDVTTVGIFEAPVARAPSYVERTDTMDRIDQAFWKVKTSQTKSPLSFFLTGRAGVGKTQLALGYCQRAHGLGHFKTILWIDTSTPETASLGLQNAADLVRKSRAGSAADKVSFIQNYLAECWHPWLLVLDNYQPKLFEGDGIYSMLPTSGCGAYLFAVASGSPPIDGESIELRRHLTYEEQRDLDDSFMDAIEGGNSSRALELLAQGASINSGWHDHRSDCSALERATLNGVTDVVKVLLSRGVDIKADDVRRGWDGSLAVRWAKHPDVMELMFDHEEKLGVRGSTKLYDGMLEDAAQGRLSMMPNGDQENGIKGVRMILERRPVSAEGLDKAMSRAAKYGRQAVMMILLQKKADYLRSADPNGSLMDGAPPKASPAVSGPPDSSQDSQEECPLLYEAVRQGNHELGKAMIAKCSELGYHLSKKAITSTLMSACWSQVWEEDAKQTRLNFIRHLLSIGADPNALNSDMPVHYCAYRGDIEVMAILLEHGAQAWIEDTEHKTPFDEAIQKGRVEVSKILLETEAADEALRRRSLSRALLWAIADKEDHKDLILSLLQVGADPNGDAATSSSPSSGDKSTDNKTPLIQSIVGGDKTLIRMLLKRGARADVQDGDGRLPLVLAVQEGQESTVHEILKRHTTAIDLKDGSGNTALIAAATKGNTSIATMLLKAGADPHLSNKYDDTALELAEETGKKEMIKLLEQWTMS